MNKLPLLSMILASSSLMAQQPAPQAAQPAMADVFMQQLDTDKDGKVTKTEFFAPYEAQFSHIDTNKDGSIDKAEVDAFEARMRQHMQQLKQQQQPK